MWVWITRLNTKGTVHKHCTLLVKLFTSKWNYHMAIYHLVTGKNSEHYMVMWVHHREHLH